MAHPKVRRGFICFHINIERCETITPKMGLRPTDLSQRDVSRKIQNYVFIAVLQIHDQSQQIRVVLII